MITKILKTKINSEYIIVDVEIGNDLSPNWDYKKADIITLGILNGNEIKIIQREKTDNLEEFKIVLKDILKNIGEFYAFNYSFEKGALKGFLDEEHDVKEIKPFKGVGFSKDKFFDELLTIVKIENETNDAFKDGSLVQEKYQQEKYSEIIDHNTNCLIKEAYIKKYKEEIFNKYKDRINSDGWIEKEREKKKFDTTGWDKERATENQIAFLLKNGKDYREDKLHTINKLDASNLINKYKKVLK